LAAQNQACDTTSTSNKTAGTIESTLDPVATAKPAKLRQVSDDMPGITRHKGEMRL
jgi:hypothetical protein